MKKTVKIAFAVVIFVLGMLLMTSCGEKNDDSGVISAAINEKDQLVVAFADGRIETVAEIEDGNLTVFEDAEIKVEVSSRGFWVIDGKSTSIKAKDSNGEFIKTNLDEFEFTLKDGTYSVKAGENFNSENIIFPKNYRGVPVTEIESGAFYNTKQLKSVIIPNSFKTLGNGCFETCENLRAVAIGSGVETIPYSSFKYCSSLERVVIGSGVKSVMNSAFYKCKAIESVYIGSIEQWCSVQLNVTGRFHLEEEGGSPLEYGADLYCSGELVKNLVIPEGITRLNNSVFANCTSIKSAFISSTAWIGSSVFKGCPNLVEVTLDDTEGLGDEAFADCKKLKNVDLGNELTVINMSSFRGCESLKSIELPESLDYIADGAFENCTGLVDFILPENVTAIGNFAFKGCSSLKTFYIGEKMKLIGNFAFQDCNKLSLVKYSIKKGDFESIEIGEGNEPFTKAEKTFDGEEEFIFRIHNS